MLAEQPVESAMVTRKAKPELGHYTGRPVCFLTVFSTGVDHRNAPQLFQAVLNQSENCYVAQLLQIKDAFGFGHDLIYCGLVASIRLGQLWRGSPPQCLGPLHI